MSYCQGCADTERALASLRASHQEVIRVVREWQEARREFTAIERGPNFAEFQRLLAAEAARAALEGK